VIDRCAHGLQYHRPRTGFAPLLGHSLKPVYAYIGLLGVDVANGNMLPLTNLSRWAVQCLPDKSCQHRPINVFDLRCVIHSCPLG
jgi:hypothetical protein